MNLVMFFEGTGQGVEGKITNVTRLKELCVEDAEQRLHIESGPGTHFGAYLFGKIFGADCRGILRDARRWFQQNYKGEGGEKRWRWTEVRIFLFGFSRGALLARKFAEWLEKIDVPVAYLGIWDTVDSAMKIDVSEECPANVLSARHAVARDERRRYFKLIPLRPIYDRRWRKEVEVDNGGLSSESNNQTIPNLKSSNSTVHLHLFSPPSSVSERIFPGMHSDVGGLYADNHDIADASLAWIAEGAVRNGLRLDPDAKLRHDVDLASAPIHDSFRLASNLWGLLGSSIRKFTEKDEE